MDIVAGFLEIDERDDTHEIVVKHPVLQPDSNGLVHFVLMPRQARHLANLLVEYATTAEAEMGCFLPENMRDRNVNRHGKSCM